MIPCDLRKWSVFGSLELNFISKIHMAIVFGTKGEEALVATKDRMVYGIRKVYGHLYCDSIDENTFSPQKVDALCGKDIKTFAKGLEFILALTEEGEVYVCRQSDRSDYEFSYQDFTLKLITLSTEKITHIACANTCALALTDTGIVHAWTMNWETGLSDDKKVSFDNMKIVHISCGYSFSVIVTNNGEVYSWGSNTLGQLGVGDYLEKHGESKITGLSGVVIEKVVCGYAHSLALSSKGCLYVWGANDHGQLGIPHIRSIKRTPSVSKPQKLKQPKMGRVYDIATCWCQNMSVAMSDTNRIFIWGYCVDKDINVPTLTSLRCLQDSFAFYSSEIYCHLLIVNDEKETNVMDSMEEAFDDASTSDLIIQVHGKPIHVHKVVLKIRSHYFRTMFQEHWTENSQSVIKHEQYSYDVYKSFLKYLYTNEVADLPQEDALELSILAEAYSEDLLKRRCLQMIRNKITVENVLLFYDASMKHNFKELEEYCFKFATYHLTDVAQTASFAELNESCIKTFITEAAKAGIFNVE